MTTQNQFGIVGDFCSDIIRLLLATHAPRRVYFEHDGQCEVTFDSRRQLMAFAVEYDAAANRVEAMLAPETTV